MTVPKDSALVEMKLVNPAASRMVLHFRQQDALGNAVAEGDAPPSDVALDTLRVAPAPGDYFFDFSSATGSPADRRPEGGYTIALGTRPELDPNDQGTRNDHGATATCLGGGGNGGTCGGGFAGMPVSFSQKGQVGSLGDRDFFRLDVASGAPAVLDVTVRMPATKIRPALDLLVPHPGSPCKSDTDCAAINVGCKSDLDCELSHSCLPTNSYPFCPNGAPCRMCAGAGACVPLDKPGGKTVCAAPQYLVHASDGMVVDQSGMSTLHTAQPLLSTGPYYLVVHDFGDARFDYGNNYQLDARVVPEPDPADQPAAAAQRNNFYNPYPMDGDDLSSSRARARDISDDLMAGRFAGGFISYQSDEDWFSFRHPCPNLDCGLVFEWTQPGPSPVHIAMLVRRDDLKIHESWTYVGNQPTSSLAGPLTLTFGEGDCHECSFASAKYGANKIYYLQVRAVGSKSWDFRGGGAYRFRLKTISPGCPLNCSEFLDNKGIPICGCFCAALNTCPPGPPL